MFKNLKYKIVHRHAMGKEQSRGNRDAVIKVYGNMQALNKYMPLGSMSLHQVTEFMGIIVDGRPSTKVDMYEKNTNRKYSIKSISKNVR